MSPGPTGVKRTPAPPGDTTVADGVGSRPSGPPRWIDTRSASHSGSEDGSAQSAYHTAKSGYPSPSVSPRDAMLAPTVAAPPVSVMSGCCERPDGPPRYS